LRELALQVAEIASRPIMAVHRELWYQHNQLEATRPLILCDPEMAGMRSSRMTRSGAAMTLPATGEFHFRKQIFWVNCPNCQSEEWITIKSPNNNIRKVCKLRICHAVFSVDPWQMVFVVS